MASRGCSTCGRTARTTTDGELRGLLGPELRPQHPMMKGHVLNFEINALVVPSGIDADAAARLLRESDPMLFVWGFESSPASSAVIGAEEERSPWEDDRLNELSDLAVEGVLASRWASLSAEDQERFRAAVRWSAERWLDAVVRICRAEDRSFEASLATWVTLESGDRLLLAPQDSDGFNSDSIYGDLFVEGQGRYSSLAAAAGIRFVDLDDLRVELR